MVRIAAHSSEERERVTCDSGDGLPGPCSVSLLTVEVSTGLREITQCLEKAPTGAFSLLQGPTSSFTVKNLLRHYAKWVLD